MKVMVLGLAVDQGDISTRNSSDWPREAIVDPHLQPSDIKIVEIAIQRRVTIACFQVSIILFSESLAKEIPHVPKDNQD